MTKYILAALALVAVLAGLWGTFEHQRASTLTEQRNAAVEAAGRLRGAVEVQRQAAAKIAAISADRQTEINRLRKESEQRQKALNEALKANPDWADARIPDLVRRALTGPGDDPAAAGPRLDDGGRGAPAPGRDERPPRDVGQGPPRGAGRGER